MRKRLPCSSTFCPAATPTVYMQPLSVFIAHTNLLCLTGPILSVLGATRESWLHASSVLMRYKSSTTALHTRWGTQPWCLLQAHANTLLQPREEKQQDFVWRREHAALYAGMLLLSAIGCCAQ